MGLNIIQNIWIADFETTTTNTEYYRQNEDTCIVYGYMKSFDGQKDYEFLNLKEMFDFLSLQDTGTMIYFHNLSFDGDFILKYLTTHMKMYNKIPRNNIGFSTLRQGNNIYEIVVQVWNKIKRKCVKIKFRCSYRILSSSVEALGKSVNMKKFTGEEGENFYDVEPVTKIEDLPKNYVEYCKRDVEIVRLSLIEFDNSMEFLKTEWPFLREFKWNGKLTASSISLKLQKDYVKAEGKKHIVRGFKHTNEENELADNFYFGGFTQFNALNQNERVPCKKGVCVDINSAHPYSMTKKLPWGQIFDKDEVSWEEDGFTKDEVIQFFHIHVENAESIYGQIACLANWPKYDNYRTISKNESDYRYVFSLEDFECYYMEEEWELMKKFYVFEGVTIKKTYWMFAEPYLKGFVDKVYQFKSDFKAQGKEGLSQTFKIILNSGYGIHAKRNDYNEYYVCDSKEEYDKLVVGTHFIWNEKEYVVSGSESELHLLDNQYIKIVERVEKPNANNKFIASAITAYSRIYLLESILKLGIDNCLYTDTDSIYIRDYKGELSDYLWIDKYELGAWDIEVEYDQFWTKGAKVYYALKNGKFVKNKYSGISKVWLKDNLSYDTFHGSMLEGAKTTMKSCKSGKVLIQKDYIPKQRFH